MHIQLHSEMKIDQCFRATCVSSSLKRLSDRVHVCLQNNGHKQECFTYGIWWRVIWFDPYIYSIDWWKSVCILIMIEFSWKSKQIPALKRRTWILNPRGRSNIQFILFYDHLLFCSNMYLKFTLSPSRRYSIYTRMLAFVFENWLSTERISLRQIFLVCRDKSNETQSVKFIFIQLKLIIVYVTILRKRHPLPLLQKHAFAILFVNRKMSSTHISSVQK